MDEKVAKHHANLLAKLRPTMHPELYSAYFLEFCRNKKVSNFLQLYPLPKPSAVPVVPARVRWMRQVREIYTREVRVVEKVKPRDRKAEILSAYRVSYYTSAGLVPCGPPSLRPSRHTNETVAVFRCRYFCRELNRNVEDVYLYGVRDGKPRELKKLGRNIL